MMAEQNTVAEPKGVAPKQPPLVLAARLAQIVEIRDVTFLEFHARQRLQGAFQTLVVSYQTRTTSRLDAEKRRIVVEAAFAMEAKPEEQAAATNAVEVRATIGLDYEFPSGMVVDEDMAKSFGQINGVYNAWPYWREFVQSAVARMGLPPLVVPVFRIGGQ